MAISRPILLALAGAILALVAFYATTGARSGDDGSGKPPEPPAAQTPAKPKAAARAGAGNAGESAVASRRGARPPGKSEARAKPSRGLPPRVERALAGRQPVVLFFFQRGGADDEATAEAVSAVRRRGRAKVFSAPISRLADYRAVTAGAGVSQAPAVLILRKGSSARLVEGFVDAETLIQQVADAR